MRTNLRRVAAAAVVAVSAVTGSTAIGLQPAAAAYSDCPAGYHCFFSGSGGVGTRWQFSGSNSNLSAYGIATQSGYNHGSSGMRHCRFEQINLVTLKTSTTQGQQHSYSARAIRSNTWTWGTCSSV